MFFFGTRVFPDSNSSGGEERNCKAEDTQLQIPLWVVLWVEGETCTVDSAKMLVRDELSWTRCGARQYRRCRTRGLSRCWQDYNCTAAQAQVGFGGSQRGKNQIKRQRRKRIRRREIDR